jgi:hypothetical protein
MYPKRLFAVVDRAANVHALCASADLETFVGFERRAS